MLHDPEYEVNRAATSNHDAPAIAPNYLSTAADRQVLPIRCA